jgi:hypothetical protein
VIIFDKFDDGQSERNRIVSVRPDITMSLVPSFVRASRAARVITLVAGRRPRTLFSNRELDLLERGVSHGKQRKATRSNRELWTVENSAKIVNSSSLRMSEELSLPVISDTNFRHLTSFLIGTASHSEFVATHSKQTTGEFLTGARIACFRSAALQLKPQECCSRVAPEQGKIPLHKEPEQEPL